jgi:phenylacetic acid degradation operon negative regulatory protein
MGTISAHLSTIKRVPISYFVYSSLSCFARPLGGALPGMWFVRAIQDAGRDPAAIRQTLYRMEAEEEIVARKVGRAKFYSPSRYADATIDAGLSRILDPPPRQWNGRWTIVQLRLRSDAQRVARERVVTLLSVEGFALLGADAYISPRDAGARIVNALPDAIRPHVIVLNGALLNAAAEASLLALWNVRRLATRYRAVLERLLAIETAIREGVTDRDAFVLRFAVVFDYLEVAWDDPNLPRELLPPDWPADNARVVAARLYRRLLTPATRHAIGLLKKTAPSRTIHTSEATP